MTDDLRELVEAAIGLNVDCGGVEGVHRVRDAVMAVVQPAIPEIIEAWCHDQQHKLATACSVGECTCAALAQHFRGQPAEPTRERSKPLPLATGCDDCRHALNWHNTGGVVGGCTVGACACRRFAPPAPACDDCGHDYRGHASIDGSPRRCLNCRCQLYRPVT